MPTKKVDMSPEDRKRKEQEETRKLLSQVDELLANVDESFIAQQNPARQYPTFDQEEVKIGPSLGVGGFGAVFEVEDFRLSRSDSDVSSSAAEDESSPPASGSSLSAPLSERDVSLNATKASQAETCSTSDDEQASTKEEVKKVKVRTQLVAPAHNLKDVHELHYDVQDARKFMLTHVRRNGDARYAIKRLHRDLSELERTRGMIDMAIEASYLKVMWHPNIVKMRGFASGPRLSPTFFICMDRLYETLDIRLKKWGEAEAKHKGFMGIRANRAELEHLLIERLVVAYDLAAAFRYMHQNKLVYRDIKQENFGFDVRGVIKVFDFGLCKSCSPSLKARDRMGRKVYGYDLTPRTGSVPYIAPEVVEGKPYDTKCDVFSFSILLWEIMSLKLAYKGYSRLDYRERVVKHKERHSINLRWPPLVRLALKESWNHDPQKRPAMKRVADLLRGDLKALSTDSNIQQRTSHMRNLSENSFRLNRRKVVLKKKSFVR